MYPHAFRYHRAASLEEAASMIAELGEDAKLLAGGQSLIPLMKLRLSSPSHLVDLNFVPGVSYIHRANGDLRLGAMARHADLAASAAVRAIPLLHDCAAGIADVQVRNRGTIGGSLAEADPSGDWGAALLALPAEVRCVGPAGERSISISDFFLDAYTTALAPGEVVREILVHVPQGAAGGAYVAFKRCAPVYATASVATQLTMNDRATCREAHIVLGCVGLTAIRARTAEDELAGKELNSQTIARAAEAAMAAADPQPDMRGSVGYKRTLVGSLTRRALEAALRRSQGGAVQGGHIYA
ncbi:MAG: xanthine dehydrogenase family protein subunit M [Acidobacteriia bacterium]|nr:xanthine dehydrogenase family protein subunit M [Terriglobia bacterium]